MTDYSVSSGESISGLVLGAGDTLTIADGGAANNITVGNGATLIGNGAITKGIITLNGGTTLLYGNPTVSYYGSHNLTWTSYHGSDDGSIIHSGGYEYINIPTISNILLLPGGNLNIGQGGFYADNPTISNLVIDGATLYDGGELQYMPSVTIENGGSLRTNAGIGNVNLINGGALAVLYVMTKNAHVVFSGGGTLEFGYYVAIPAGVSFTGFGQGGVLRLEGVAPETVNVSSNGTAATIDGIVLTDISDPSLISVQSDGSGGSLIKAADTGVLNCFAEGTRIATSKGYQPVETFAVGDRVRSHFGGLVPIKWIGHRRIQCNMHPRPHDILPVRIQRDAFATGVPERDTRLSPDHAVLIDGKLVPIRYLLNGATICQEDARTVTYWHIELDQHDVLLAEGLGCESYLDTGNRSAFDNAGPVVMHTADFARGVWEAEACAPLVLGEANLRKERARLISRARTLGHALSTDPGLHLLVDGNVLLPTIQGDTYHFALPGSASLIQLVSRTFVPADHVVETDDRRRFGVAVIRLTLDGHDVSLDDPRLADGWEAAEAHWRWTHGNAQLRCVGEQALVIQVAPIGQYWAKCQPPSPAGIERAA